MKPKKPKKSALVANITEDRILGLSNDLSEDIESGTVKEWRAVALFFRDQFDKQTQHVNSIQMSAKCLAIWSPMVVHSLKTIGEWVKRDDANRGK